MIHNITFRTFTILVVFVALLGPRYVKSQTPDRCAEVLKHGLYNYENISTSSQYKKDYLDFLYYSNFQSSQEATDAGIDLTVPIPGSDIILGGSGNFDSKKYQEWRSEYSHHIQEHITYNQAYASVRKYVEISLVKAWSECIYATEKSKQKGLISEFIPIDDDHVEFRAEWVAFSGIDNSRILSFEVHGGVMNTPISQNFFKKGNALNSAKRSVIFKRVTGKTLIVVLRLKNDDVAEKFPAPSPGAILSLSSDKPVVEIGKNVVVTWNTDRIKNVKLNGTAVPTVGNQTFPISQRTIFLLTGTNLLNKPVSQEIAVEAVSTPIYITSGKVIFSIPAWADGKDDNTLIKYTISTENGQLLVASCQRGGDNDKCEVDQGQSLEMVMTFNGGDMKTFTKELLPRIQVHIDKIPNGNDALTCGFDGVFNLSNGAVARFACANQGDHMHFDSNDPQSWTGIVNVSWP